MAAIMDVASAIWLSELDMDEYSIIHQCHVNSFIDEMKAADEILIGATNLQQSFSSSSSHHDCYIYEEKPSKHLKINHIPPRLPSSPLPPPPHSLFLSFENFGSNDKPANSLNCTVKPEEEILSPGRNPVNTSERNQIPNNANQLGIKRAHSMTRSPHAQDHIIAERKRREKLSQKFIALSAIVPGLKKMDKVSILGDAIKHIKHLQERVKELEAQTKKRTVESIVLVKNSQIFSEDQSFSSDENSNGGNSDSGIPLPEIMVRVSDNDVLIRIHCEKQKGHLVKILSEIEKVHLSIVNSSILPFGDSTFDITVIAQKEDGFDMKLKDLANNLRSALLKFI